MTKAPHAPRLRRSLVLRSAGPEDDCLRRVMEMRYGLRHRCQACGASSTFHRLARRRAFSCARCGRHVYPCAGTIFQDSRIALGVWFKAIDLCTTRRPLTSTSELGRQLGLAYKTAWRMRHQILSLNLAIGEPEPSPARFVIQEVQSRSQPRAVRVFGKG